MVQKIAKHRANDASNDVHRPPLAKAEVDEMRKRDKIELEELATRLRVSLEVIQTYLSLVHFPPQYLRWRRLRGAPWLRWRRRG